MKKRKNLTAWFNRTGASKWARRQHFTGRQFEPYVKAIGQLLLSWNDLHERLAMLFIMALGGGWVDRPLALWHSVRNDVGKRKLLRAAMDKMPENEKAGREKLVDEINWILDAADALEGLRDDSAHTPLSHSSGNLLTYTNSLVGVTPETIFQNPRALRLFSKNRNMVIEYRYARERIIVLRDYAIAIDLAWSRAALPWPDRPDLPERKPIRKRKGRATLQRKK